MPRERPSSSARLPEHELVRLIGDAMDQCPERHVGDFGVVILASYDMGAAVAFGLMGMAEAIRANRERPIDVLLGKLRAVTSEWRAEPIDDETMRLLATHFAAEDEDG